jgi:hypothetical protein
MLHVKVHSDSFSASLRRLREKAAIRSGEPFLDLSDHAQRGACKRGVLDACSHSGVAG